MKAAAVIVITFLLSLSGMVYAQQGNDVIYLRDGSMIRGTIIEKIAGSHIKIMTPDGVTKQFPIEELDKMKMVGVKEPFEFKPVGYINSTSIGLLIGQTNYGLEARPSLLTVNGISIGRKWQLGIGTGIEQIRGNWNMPLFAEARLHFGQGSVSPYVALQAGYQVPLPVGRVYAYDSFGPYELNDRNGGFMVGTEIGIRNVVKKHFGYNVSLGYRLQTDSGQSYQYFWNETGGQNFPVSYRTTMHRICLRVGLLFN